MTSLQRVLGATARLGLRSARVESERPSPIMSVITSQALFPSLGRMSRNATQSNSDVHVYDRAPASFANGLAQRGHHIIYRANAENHCPGCGRSHWHIGRITAECGFCGTAVPLAEARHDDAAPQPTRRAPASTNQRRFPR